MVTEGKGPNSVFLSYAREDDEPFVRRLYLDLQSAGHTVWWDRESMPSRPLTFPQEIRDAIEGSDRLVLVVGPKAISSEYVQAEWEHALLFGRSVVPILRRGDYESVPGRLSKLHIPDFRTSGPYVDALRELLRILGEPLLPLGMLYGVPSLPPLLHQHALKIAI
jgi:TIR domain